MNYRCSRVRRHVAKLLRNRSGSRVRSHEYLIPHEITFRKSNPDPEARTVFDG